MIISISSRKNIKMVVYHNKLPSGKIESITRFEPLDPDRPVYKRTFRKPSHSR
jgi:hypothetical protein